MVRDHEKSDRIVFVRFYKKAGQNLCIILTCFFYVYDRWVKPKKNDRIHKKAVVHWKLVCAINIIKN